MGANLYLAPKLGRSHGIPTLQLVIRLAIKEEEAAHDLAKDTRLYMIVTAETSLGKGLYELVTVTTIDITETSVVAIGMNAVLAAVLPRAMIETAAGKEKEKENEKRSEIEIETETVIVIVIITIVNGDMIATLVVTETAVATGNNLTVSEDGHEKRIETQSATNPETKNETGSKIEIETKIKTETETVIENAIETGAGNENETETRITTGPSLDVGARRPSQPALVRGTLGSGRTLARPLENDRLPGGGHALLVN